jgi:hypothetical protein
MFKLVFDFVPPTRHKSFFTFMSLSSTVWPTFSKVCRGRIADMTLPEDLRVDTDGGIKPGMAFLALLADSSRGNSSLPSLLMIRTCFLMEEV